MIHDVDETLRALFRREGVTSNEIEMAFDAPTKDWASRRNTPTIDVYLYDIRENLDRRTTMYNEVLDDDGRLIQRRPSPRFFNLSYLITAWTQRPEDEHRLLSSALLCFVKHKQLPRELLVGNLLELDLNTAIAIARPPTTDRAISDIWSALGGELKPSLDLVLTVPIQPEFEYFMGPPVYEAPSIRYSGPGGAIELPPSYRNGAVLDELARTAAGSVDELARQPGTGRAKHKPVGRDAWGPDVKTDPLTTRVLPDLVARGPGTAAAGGAAAGGAGGAARAGGVGGAAASGRGRGSAGAGGPGATGTSGGSGGSSPAQGGVAPEGLTGRGAAGRGAAGRGAPSPAGSAAGAAEGSGAGIAGPGERTPVTLVQGPGMEDLLAGSPKLPGRRFRFHVMESKDDKKKPDVRPADKPGPDAPS